MRNEEILQKCQQAGIEITETERRNPHLLHAKLGE
jgi:HD superfamily phosphohydrolase YqeK